MNDILELLQKNPDIVVPMIKGVIAKFKPAVYELLQEVLEIYKDFANNEEYPATVAKVKKNMFDAYVKAGFSEDQAFALIINDNLQLIRTAEKISGSTNTRRNS